VSRDSISFDGLRPLRLLAAPPNDALRDGVQSLAALLPGEFRFHGPSARRLERLQTALRNEDASLRPLAVEFASAREAWRSQAEWLLGSDVLVAPFLESGAREIWLPPGSWMRLGSQSEETAVAGPARVRVEPLLGLPAVFVRRERMPGYEALGRVWSAE
jgi:hypothetical protein